MTCLQWDPMVKNKLGRHFYVHCVYGVPPQIIIFTRPAQIIFFSEVHQCEEAISGSYDLIISNEPLSLSHRLSVKTNFF